MPNPYPQGYGRGGYQAPNTNMGGPGNPRGVYNSPQQSGAYYGPSYPQSYSGQQPGLNRYQPPMMYGDNPNNWTQGGGYSYNLPNSYGHAYNGGYGGVVPQYAYGQRSSGVNGMQQYWGVPGNQYSPQNGGGMYGGGFNGYGGRANDVYMQQPRGTGRGGGGNYMNGMNGYGMGGDQMMQAFQAYMGQQLGGQGSGVPQWASMANQSGQYGGMWGMSPFSDPYGNPDVRDRAAYGGGRAYGDERRAQPQPATGYAKPAANSNPAVPQPVTPSGYDWSTSPLGWPRP